MSDDVLRDASGVVRPLYDPVPRFWPFGSHTSHRRAIFARIRKRAATPFQRRMLWLLIPGLGLTAAFGFVFFAWILFRATGSFLKPLFPLTVAAMFCGQTFRSLWEFPDVGTPRIAQAMLDEGLCPSCGYEFGVEWNAEIDCSECGSRWARTVARLPNAN